MFYFESFVHNTINVRLNKKFIDYNVLFCDIKNNTLIFEHMGETLTKKYDYSKHNTKEKLMLFDQLVSNINRLIDIGIIHNDIKPTNLCIKDNKLTLIDYGNAYIIPNDINDECDFNTTYFSASPEYLLLANMESFPEFPPFDKKYKYNDEQLKILEIIKKMQHMALAGILIGMLVNNINFYYDTFLEITQHYLHDIDDNTMDGRFDLIDEPNIHKITEICLKKLIRENIDQEIIDIIVNMLSFNYHNRLPLDEISIWLKQLYDQKIIEVKTTNEKCVEK